MKDLLLLLSLIRKEVLLMFFISAGLVAGAQSNELKTRNSSMPIMQSAAYNLSSFTPQLLYKNRDFLYTINSQSGAANPDFGKIAWGVNPAWYEQYSKRTATSRSFVAEDGSIVSGNSYSPINYLDKKGNYVAINPALSSSANGWSAMHQQFPTFLHPDGSTEISLSENDHLKFNFNNSIAGNNISVNKFTAGDNGMMIYNAVEGVDKRMIFLENKIETDYLLNKPLTGVSGDLVISEEIVLPEGYSIKEKNLDAPPGKTSNRFELVVVNSHGVECAHFKMPVCYDSNMDKSQRQQSHCYGKYELRNESGKTFLDIVISSAWLNDAARIYPVTIDPVVTGPTTEWAGGIINSCYEPSFNTATINVTVPANITITNFYVTASYYADVNTFTSEDEGDMYFTTSCGRDPANTSYYYTVPDPGGYNSGTAYLSQQDMGSTLAFCLSPSCSTQTLALTMYLGRTWDLYGYYDCDDYYIYYEPSTLYPFEAYIVGRSVEITGSTNNWTVSPTSLCSNVCSLTLNATIDGGIPPYTMSHAWASSSTTFGSHIANTSTSNGSGSLTLTIPNCPSTCNATSVLSVPAPTITDACGNIVSGVAAKNITQNPIPVVTPNPVSTSVCSGAPVNIINTSCVAGSTITWTGSNGSSGSGNIVNSPVNNGSSPITVNYTVTASVSGCAGTPVVVPVTVNPAPSVAVLPAAPLMCNGQSVMLTASGGSSYTWSPSNGLSSTTGAIVTANPISTTIYTVNGTDANGCTNTTNVTVAIRTPPTINVTPPSGTVCVGQSVSLTASGASTYSWTPPNGLSATTGATVSASPPSTYIYTVTGTDVNGCTNTTLVTVNVQTAPAINVNPPTPSYCFGKSVSLTASGGISYTWSPSGGLSAASGATVTANPSSTTGYTVIGTDANGCTNTANVMVTVNQLPVININPVSPSVCGGQSVSLTANGASTYIWSPGTGLSATSGTTVSANPLIATTYTVTGTDIHGCTNTGDVSVSINPPAVITVNPTSMTICSGQSVSLTAGGGSTYSWSPSIGLSSSSGATVSASPTSTVTYTVTGTDANGCSNTSTSVLTVNTSFAINAGPDINICPGASAQINVIGAPAGSSYSWTPSTNLSCNNCSNPTATPSVTTTYIVQATSPAGCNGWDTIVVNVTPLSATTGLNNTLVCSGSTVQLNASGGTSYSWSPSTGLSDTAIAGPLAIILSTTTYTVTVSTGNCSATASVTISTYPALPTPIITQSEDTLFCSTSLLYKSYQWYFNSTPINGATDSIYIATQSGNYNVAIQDSNGCFTSVGTNIILNVGLNNLSSGNTILLYPNPAGNELIIKTEGVILEKIGIYNLLGELIYSQKFEIKNQTSNIPIDVSFLDPGIYFLQLQQPQGNWIGRFVKE